MSILDQKICLKLNRNWQAIDIFSIKEALVAMNSGVENVAAIAMDIRYTYNNGKWDFEHPEGIVPVNFNQWVKLPIREFDMCIRTPKMLIRAPTVIIAQNYDKLPKRNKRLSHSAIRERDGNICQVTGQKIPNEAGNIDHLRPKCRGGKDTWENLVWMRKDLNSLKKDKTLEEMGWKLIRQPKAPPVIVAPYVINEIRHRDWKFFL